MTTSGLNLKESPDAAGLQGTNPPLFEFLSDAFNKVYHSGSPVKAPDVHHTGSLLPRK